LSISAKALIAVEDEAVRRNGDRTFLHPLHIDAVRPFDIAQAIDLTAVRSAHHNCIDLAGSDCIQRLLRFTQAALDLGEFFLGDPQATASDFVAVAAGRRAVAFLRGVRTGLVWRAALRFTVLSIVCAGF
jgi:hypothetical protein